MEGEKQKSGRFLIFIILFLFSVVGTTQGAWNNDDLVYAKSTAEMQKPVHNINTTEDFETIQAAIDDPDTKDGHTISVDAGIYRERVLINKQLKIIGANKDNTIIDAYGSGSCIKVTADNAEIRGFRIKNGNYGIYLESSNCRVTDNYIISVDFDGIFLRSNSVSNTIANNSISKVKGKGIRLSSSCNNRIEDNDLSGNGKGISLSSSHDNTIYNNSLTNNNNCGICLSSSNNNSIQDNDLSGSEEGIFLRGCNRNYVCHNNFIDNIIQASDSSDSNRWDNGPKDGGNYWSDHKCTGNPSDGNQPYNISGGIMGATDYYPFMDRDGWLVNLTVTILYPNGGESIPVGTQVPVSVHVTDDTAVTNVTFFYSSNGGSHWYLIGAGIRVSGTDKDGIWNGTWNTNGLSVGSNYMIKAVASDGIRTIEDLSDSNFSLSDIIPPTVTISYPPNEQMLTTPTITVNGTASDNVEVNKVEVKVGSGSWQTASGTTSWSTPVTLAPGSNTINASATDTSGNTNQTRVTVICDMLANLTVTILYPNGGESIPVGTQVPVSVHATDDTAVTNVNFSYSSNGGSNWNIIGAGIRVSGTDKDGIWNGTWNTNGLSAGSKYMIKAVASDGTLTIEDLSDRNFSLCDTIPPTVTISYPPNEQMLTTPTITVNGNASDNVAVSKVEVKVGPGGWQTALGTTSWSTPVTLAPGSNTINASVADTSGNTNHTSVKVTYDMLANLTVTILYPNGGESIPVGTQVPVSVHATDDTAVTNVTFFYSSNGGSNWDLIGAGIRVSGTDKDGIWNGTWNTNGLSVDSNYMIKAVASDGTLAIEDRSDSNFSLCTLPSPPTLTDPGTNDTDGNYIVSWSTVSSATNYTLEEDTSSSFSSPTKIYSGSGTSKEITGKSNGIYYYQVKACNACGCSERSNREDIKIRGPLCYAIIIAGGKGDPSQPCFDLTANKVYKKLLTCGFTHKRIFYLNPSMEQDGDGIYDVDRITSLRNITHAINTWAQGNVGANDSLLLYMVNHGEKDIFFVNGDDIWLTATKLDERLDIFTSKTKCEDIVVVYDACYSGSFIDELTGTGRIIVTSTNITANATFDETKGGIFSHYFFISISAGKTIKEAFEDASNSFEIQLYFKSDNRTPLLDDNGDRIGHAINLSDSGYGRLENSSGDGRVAKLKYICIRYGASISPPTITDVIPSQKVVLNTPITIWTVVANDSSIKYLYARIKEPNFSISPTNDSLINLTPMYLEDPDGNAIHTASFTPTKLGNYTLALQATDEEGNMALSKQCMIRAVLSLESAIFDTGEETHTYSWKETGGHSEYEKIWNSTRKGVEAYFLRGEITHREFVDTKGHLNNNGIPAIKLEEV